MPLKDSSFDREEILVKPWYCRVTFIQTRREMFPRSDTPAVLVDSKFRVHSWNMLLTITYELRTLFFPWADEGAKRIPKSRWGLCTRAPAKEQ